MTRPITRWLRSIVLLLVAVPSLALAVHPRHRPIEEFVKAQGTYCYRPTPVAPCFLAEGPIGNVIGWMTYEDGFRRFARVDFAGLVDRYLVANGLPAVGTTFGGTITERPLKDGRAEVTVVLHTRNAPAWIRFNPWTDKNGDGLGTSDEVSGPSYWVWGRRAAELAAGAEPTLVDVEYTLVFVNPSMGHPMPDLLQFSFDPVYQDQAGDLKRLSTSIAAWGVGELNADAALIGLGTAGEPLALGLTQVGLFSLRERLSLLPEVPSWLDRFLANGGWLVEVLELQPVGFGR